MDGTYRLSMRYLGRSAAPLEFQGCFEWLPGGSVIRLRDLDGIPGLYRVEENRLRHLDSRGQLIAGPPADNYLFARRSSN